jgi:diacylglycerol kinase (ATP)
MNQPADRVPGGESGATVPAIRSKSSLGQAIMQDKRAALVVNTRSRRGQRLYPAVLARLRAEGFNLLGSFPSSRPGELGASLEAAIDLRPDLLIVGGGDGSISEATHRLAHRDMALGLLPLGTTNNFARTLAIPLNLAEAIGVLTGGKVADVDLGHAGDAVFANLVSTGLSAQVAVTVPHQLKRVLGRAAYPLTALAALPRHRAFRARITVGDRTYTLNTHQLNIANGSFHGGRPIAGDTGADDRLLLVYPLGGPARPSLVTATLRHVISGARRSMAEPAFLAVSELWLDTDPPLPLDVDGELRGRTPTRIVLAPNALRVMVTPDFPDT